MGDSGRIVAQQFQSGFWFKQDLTFVNVRNVLSDMSLLGIRIYEFDRDSANTTMMVSGEVPWPIQPGNYLYPHISAASPFARGPFIVFQTDSKASVVSSCGTRPISERAAR